jgi:hypothetical protein
VELASVLDISDGEVGNDSADREDDPVPARSVLLSLIRRIETHLATSSTVVLAINSQGIHEGLTDNCYDLQTSD